MKTYQILLCSLLLAFILPKCSNGQQEPTISNGDEKLLKQEGTVTVKLSVLGGGVDMTITYLYLTNPETEEFFYNKTTVDQGDNREKTYEIYDPARGEVYTKTYTRLGKEELERYLKPENLIESNDPVLVDKAHEITAGSSDSWEAVKKLSKLVAENIEGAVPGGTSAINTYKTRQGECGSHSRLLAAFCRAVGIPSRLSVGCMYSSLYGGSFGQHAWTEVYMGDAGWIPVDATINEFDYIDSGHIRLGERASFHPKEIDILYYKTDSGEVNQEQQ